MRFLIVPVLSVIACIAIYGYTVPIMLSMSYTPIVLLGGLIAIVTPFVMVEILMNYYKEQGDEKE